MLDSRQRAMLEAMRVPVWLPQRQVDAPETIADEAAPVLATGRFNTETPLAEAPAAAGGHVLLPLQQPYGPGAEGAATWLVVVEAEDASPAAFGGDAGRLLDAMLRALRLHKGPAVHLARLLRAGTAPTGAEAGAALADGIAALRPAVVLALGRLPAQLLLGSAEPLGRLRGRVHAAHGTRLVVGYDPARLLRAPADKAHAWADLCLAADAAEGAGAAGAAGSPP